MSQNNTRENEGGVIVAFAKPPPASELVLARRDQLGRMIKEHYATLLARPIAPQLRALADRLRLTE